MGLIETLRLGKLDRIITAWAEHSEGPGWRNSLVYVLIEGADGNLRIEGLQPNEQSYNMGILFNVSAVISKELTECVRRAITDEQILLNLYSNLTKDI